MRQRRIPNAAAIMNRMERLCHLSLKHALHCTMQWESRVSTFAKQSGKTYIGVAPWVQNLGLKPTLKPYSRLSVHGINICTLHQVGWSASEPSKAGAV